MGHLVRLPQSLGLKVANRLFGHTPSAPRWPYPAVRALAALLQPDWRVLEFGAGRSTLWLADRCAEVVSIEGSTVWEAYIRKRAETCSGRVRVIRRDLEDYADTSAFGDASFDLCVIDGVARHRCFGNALRVVRPGGYIYLENSESDEDAALYQHEGDSVLVRRVMRQAASDTGADLREYRGLVVGEVRGGEGVLFRKPGH